MASQRTSLSTTTQQNKNKANAPTTNRPEEASLHKKNRTAISAEKGFCVSLVNLPKPTMDAAILREYFSKGQPLHRVDLDIPKQIAVLCFKSEEGVLSYFPKHLAPGTPIPETKFEWLGAIVEVVEGNKLLLVQKHEASSTNDDSNSTHQSRNNTKSQSPRTPEDSPLLQATTPPRDTPDLERSYRLTDDESTTDYSPPLSPAASDTPTGDRSIADLHLSEQLQQQQQQSFGSGTITVVAAGSTQQNNTNNSRRQQQAAAVSRKRPRAPQLPSLFVLIVTGQLPLGLPVSSGSRIAKASCNTVVSLLSAVGQVAQLVFASDWASCRVAARRLSEDIASELESRDSTRGMSEPTTMNTKPTDAAFILYFLGDARIQGPRGNQLNCTMPTSKSNDAALDANILELVPTLVPSFVLIDSHCFGRPSEFLTTSQGSTLVETWASPHGMTLFFPEGGIDPSTKRRLGGQDPTTNEEPQDTDDDSMIPYDMSNEPGPFTLCVSAALKDVLSSYSPATNPRPRSINTNEFFSGLLDQFAEHKRRHIVADLGCAGKGDYWCFADTGVCPGGALFSATTEHERHNMQGRTTSGVPAVHNSPPMPMPTSMSVAAVMAVAGQYEIPNLPADSHFLYCAICRTSVSGSKNFIQHLSSSKHTKSLLCCGPGEKQLHEELLLAVQGLGPWPAGVLSKFPPMSDDARFCSVCDTYIQGLDNWNIHINGRQHQRKAMMLQGPSAPRTFSPMFHQQQHPPSISNSGGGAGVGHPTAPRSGFQRL